MAAVAGGRGRGGPDVNPLLDNPYLAFEHGSEAFHRCEKLWRIEINGHAAVDWMTLEEVDEVARARDFIGHDTPWDRVMDCEFLASFEFAPKPTDQLEELNDPEESWIEVSFHLASEWHEMSLREFVVHCDLYTLEETDTPSTQRAFICPPFDSLQVLAGDQFGSL
ncbi:hypothetical protein Hanom_Chr11g01016721 [Helianthus anomalus]